MFGLLFQTTMKRWYSHIWTYLGISQPFKIFLKRSLHILQNKKKLDLTKYMILLQSDYILQISVSNDFYLRLYFCYFSLSKPSHIPLPTLSNSWLFYCYHIHMYMYVDIYSLKYNLQSVHGIKWLIHSTSRSTNTQKSWVEKGISEAVYILVDFIKCFTVQFLLKCQL